MSAQHPRNFEERWSIPVLCQRITGKRGGGGLGLEVSIKGTSQVVPWLRLCAPDAGGLGSIPGRGTRSHTLQPRPGAGPKTPTKSPEHRFGDAACLGACRRAVGGGGARSSLPSSAHRERVLCSRGGVWGPGLCAAAWGRSGKRPGVGFPGGSDGLPAMRETRVRSLSRENPLEQEMATHSRGFPQPGALGP